MNRKKTTTSVLFLLLSIGGIQAQETLPASGGNASGSGGSVSYTVGQVFYSSNSATNGTVTQGVQQPFEISEITGLEEVQEINLTVSAYPNPTTDYLTLSIDEFDISNLSYQLYDMQGKLLQLEKISENQTSIVMNNLVPATYFVKVLKGSTEVKTFKIIKNH